MHRPAVIALMGLTASMQPLAGQGPWRLYEETSIVGTISGTVQTGHVFRTVSGNIYEIIEPFIDVVVEVMPDVLVLTNGTVYRLQIDGFSQPAICRKLNEPSRTAAPQSAAASSNAELVARALNLLGFVAGADSLGDAADRVALRRFQTVRGLAASGLADSATVTALVDTLANRTPKTVQALELSLTLLRDLRTPNQVRSPVPPAAASSPGFIEGRIDGEFTGYEMGKIFKLRNGQVWEQISATYRYRYRFGAEVMIVRRNGRYELRAEDMDDWVVVQRIR